MSDSLTDDDLKSLRAMIDVGVSPPVGIARQLVYDLCQTREERNLSRQALATVVTEKAQLREQLAEALKDPNILPRCPNCDYGSWACRRCGHCELIT